MLSTSGWASAAERVLGSAWIATPGQVIDVAEARRRGSHPGLASPQVPGVRRRLPVVAKIAARDVMSWRGARRFEIPSEGPWSGDEVAFVWQRHSLFQQAGLRLADRLRVPGVVFVPAPIVWEAAQWGVRRPGWGGWLERHGEQPALQRARLVACGTDVVAEQVERLGVRRDRILITPSGVDPALFRATGDPRAVRAQLGLEGRFVVGWVGSFRRFHAVERAVEALAPLGGSAALLLVGDGPERREVERRARERGIETVSTGTVPQAELAPLLAAMDVALVLAPAQGAFHYSPLKLVEYQAAGVAVVAPDLGAIRERITDGEDGVIVPAGDAAALTAALARLRDDPEGRARIGAAARARVAASGSWDAQVRRVVDALDG